MIAHIYARVSTNIQAERGYSLSTQLEACRKKAAELGAYAVVEHVDDGFSGGEIDRPAMNELRAALKENPDRINYVICYDPDRLARNLSHQLIITDEIEKARAQLVFVSVEFENSPEGKLFYSIRGAVSAYEKEKIKERTNRGKLGKAKSGKLIQNTNPYGYGWDKENSMYIINEESPVIEKIFTMAADGVSTAAIAKQLNHNNIPTKQNKKWHPATIHKVLRNTLYKGQAVLYKEKTQRVKHKKIIEKRQPEEWLTISCPAIVSDKIFDKAQLEIQKQQKFSKRNTKQTYLLQRILFCAQCGCKMKISTWKQQKYYYCSSGERNNMLNLNIICHNHAIKTEVLDEFVWNSLVQLIAFPDKIRSMIKVDNHALSYAKLFDNLKIQEQKLIKERDAVMKWFRQNLIEEQEASRQLQDIKKQLADIGLQLNEIASKKNAVTDVDAKVQNFIDTIRNAQNRREAILSVIDRVEYERLDKARGNTSNPEIAAKFFIK